jgi:hypothetical protein
MKKFLSINKKHNKILTSYLNKIDGFIYEVTEFSAANKWSFFQPLKSEAIRLHNELGKDFNKEKFENPKSVHVVSQTEWVFMLPNFLLFGSIGFATALKDGENDEYINEEINNLYRSMTKTIVRLDEMICEHNEKIDVELQRQKTKLKQTKKTK